MVPIMNLEEGEAVLKGLTDEQVGRLFKSYIEEGNHSGWDEEEEGGRDLEVLADLITYIQVASSVQ